MTRRADNLKPEANMTVYERFKMKKRPNKADSKRFEYKKILSYSLMGLLFFAVLFYALLISLQPSKYDLRVGQVVPEDILSPKSIVDQHRTRLMREEAVSDVMPVYRLDNEIYPEVKKDIDAFFESVYLVRNEPDLSVNEMVSLLGDNVLGITSFHLDTMVNTPVDRLQNLQNYLYEIVAQRMNDGIKVADLQQEKSQIRSYFDLLTEFDEGQRETAITIINATIRPNEFLDVETTELNRREAEEAVESIVIRRGDPVVRQGERVTSDRLVLMRELGLLEGEHLPDIQLYAGIMLIVVLSMILMTVYLWQFQSSLLYQTDKLFMLILIFLIIVVIAKPLAILSPYLIPVAAGAMLLSLLLDPRLALMSNLVLTLIIGLMAGNDALLIVMGLVGGTAGVLSMIHSQQRGTIFISGIIVGIANMIVVSVFALIGMHESINLLTDVSYAFLNGILCSILTIGSLPFWEYAFSILTPLKLVELSNPSHPLLKRLLMEASGTYHHSIIVGNMAESAVNAVGGDGLLVRTGAFYHDIGKLKRPYFFKENQYMMENPHDKLTPSLSTLIITGHVKEGLEIAAKYKLPNQIKAFIAEHHGTTLAAYFYHKAKSESSEPNKIDEHMYRYNGPIPQSRETAILMLADSVEAAVRSMENPTRDRIEQMVQKIMQGKIDDRQLENSDLTLKELKVIQMTYTKMLSGIMHERVKYPELELKELKGKFS
jgi:cyclic-di-AMP phosphodiesterase PgpH